MIHTVIVPGVGGSEYGHWQSWLQRQLMSCSRVEQQDWNAPVLKTWVEQFRSTVAAIDAPLQIVAHSFGCLTTVAALAQYPALQRKVKNLVLVAPANPGRFGEAGFARDSQHDYQDYFHQLQVQVPASMLISENDPWLNAEHALELAQSWQLEPVSLGHVGHINVASGFGPFPELWNYLISEKSMQHISITDDSKYLFKFAI
ncbi:alpha/beta hydrolase [Acinetobacter indicus]|uniref:alpha/beta hydrolase n=1 Tax=Acinetobacter indicus TaxID=756892 RepID=UPI000CEBF6EA|nr:alpha/beta hydrolase [Acinetobacter indicus]MCO8098738.1 alpha/beta hydrolase [Acinetobacter indicus]MCO8104361.1 alpha/beta hydrolase [Acinetobacter indicus]MCO8110016.1 alpha/beta hydrolase [Acinetobacter indicus]MDM1243476.1 alpha/beta hydrolase [Acinetobacter indicus]MDM1268683.1 alpha/beta hydrolase [Acinetobacter indicus]